MNIVRQHIKHLLEKDSREDGRKLEEFRKVSVEYDVSKKAEGSARVRIGKTDVIVGVKMEVGVPYPDEPEKGSIMANVELRPGANPNFEDGPPSIKAIELARAIIDRGLRESDALDLKKLCIKKGEKMWIVVIDAYPINDAGNLADAIGLGALAALKKAYFPKYDEKAERVIYEKSKNKLKLKESPVPVTVLKIDGKFIVDPTLDEEEAMDARLTVSTTEDGRICAMQKGGDEPITEEELLKMVDLAVKKGKDLRGLLK